MYIHIVRYGTVQYQYVEVERFYTSLPKHPTFGVGYL